MHLKCFGAESGPNNGGIHPLLEAEVYTSQQRVNVVAIDGSKPPPWAMGGSKVPTLAMGGSEWVDLNHL